MGISDEEGYLLAIGICCLTAFFIEYFIPKKYNITRAIPIEHVRFIKFV